MNDYWYTAISVGMLMLFAIGLNWAQRRPRGYVSRGRPVTRGSLPKVPAGPAQGVHAADPAGHRYEHIERDGDLVAVVCTRCGAHWEVEQG